MTTIVRPGRRGVRKEKDRAAREVETYPYRVVWRCRECGCRFRVNEGDPVSHTISPRDPDEWHATCPNPECGERVKLTEPFPVGCWVLIAVAVCVIVVVLVVFGSWQ